VTGVQFPRGKVEHGWLPVGVESFYGTLYQPIWQQAGAKTAAKGQVEIADGDRRDRILDQLWGIVCEHWMGKAVGIEDTIAWVMRGDNAGIARDAGLDQDGLGPQIAVGNGKKGRTIALDRLACDGVNRRQRFVEVVGKIGGRYVVHRRVLVAVSGDFVARVDD
jgi:hypothetical protein